MEAQEIFEILSEKFGEKVGEPLLDGKEPQLPVKPEAIAEVAAFCKEDERLRFDYLNCLSGVDMGETLSVAYHMESFGHGHAICLRVDGISRDGGKLPTVSKIWPTANWHEREAFDLVGMIFEGHPDLKRILCAEDWEGHPLRKDYEQPDEYHGIPNKPHYMDFWGEQERWV